MENKNVVQTVKIISAIIALAGETVLKNTLSGNVRKMAIMTTVFFSGIDALQDLGVLPTTGVLGNF